MRAPEDIPANKPKKIYRKPELNTLDPQAAIKVLKPLELAGDEDAQQLIAAITDRHGPSTESQH